MDELEKRELAQQIANRTGRGWLPLFQRLEELEQWETAAAALAEENGDGLATVVELIDGQAKAT